MKEEYGEGPRSFEEVYANGGRNPYYAPYKRMLRRIARKLQEEVHEVENEIYRVLHPELGEKDAEGQPRRKAWQRRYNDPAHFERTLLKILRRRKLRAQRKAAQEPVSLEQPLSPDGDGGTLLDRLAAEAHADAAEAERELDAYLRQCAEASTSEAHRRVAKELRRLLMEGDPVRQHAVARKCGVHQGTVSRSQRKLRQSLPRDGLSR